MVIDPIILQKDKFTSVAVGRGIPDVREDRSKGRISWMRYSFSSKQVPVCDVMKVWYETKPDGDELKLLS